MLQKCWDLLYWSPLFQTSSFFISLLQLLMWKFKFYKLHNVVGMGTRNSIHAYLMLQYLVQKWKQVQGLSFGFMLSISYIIELLQFSQCFTWIFSLQTEKWRMMWNICKMISLLNLGIRNLKGYCFILENLLMWKAVRYCDLNHV